MKGREMQARRKLPLFLRRRPCRMGTLVDEREEAFDLIEAGGMGGVK
ncbi:hypothetical protein IVB16_32645 [Bradyrhizobium sp. 183]|nr:MULTISPECIES: hypothetical protein [unclassified Bradyrhizobium]UPJ79418.1 hypothetical protein IVB17_32640 [Bradyrhizobium sp. 184]UPJ87214.1 hypothetical protein IVB16_32645 [Bradyrhizobium sp. 183]